GLRRRAVSHHLKTLKALLFKRRPVREFRTFLNKQFSKSTKERFMRMLRLARAHAAQGQKNAKQFERFCKGLAALAVVVIVAAVAPVAAQAACSGTCGEEEAVTGLANPPEWSEGRKIHFEPETAKASAYSEAELEGEGGPLLYHESANGVQHTPKVYLVLWGSNFNTNEKGKEVKAMLLKLFEGLSSSSYQGILTQYFDSTGRISSSVSTSSWVDESVAAPSSV